MILFAVLAVYELKLLFSFGSVYFKFNDIDLMTVYVVNNVVLCFIIRPIFKLILDFLYNVCIHKFILGQCCRPLYEGDIFSRSSF